MTLTANEIGPGATPGADRRADENAHHHHLDSTEPASVPHLSADEIQASRPTYCLLVKTPTERVTRRLFLSLHAAIKATERAQMRGHAVSLELVRLVPYTTGTELHEGVDSDA